MLRVAILHNRYQQPGGEDAVVEQEAALLRDRGHEVGVFLADNRSIEDSGRLRLAIDTVWSSTSAADVSRFLEAERPDVLHVHNTFPLLSPAVYSAARGLGIPVVQSLHNYRLLCPAATFFRDGKVCTDCLGRTIAWPGVLHACYRGDRKATAVAATMLAVHRAKGTWRTQVDAYTVLAEFARERFVAGGLPVDRLHVRPNFRPDPGPVVLGRRRDGGYAVYAGRLAEEKGLRTLIDAWGDVAFPLEILGDGPLRHELAARAPRGVRFHGHVPSEEVTEKMLGASFVIVPSIWPEPFGMVVVEAFSLGVPVIASRLGSLPELVESGETGLLVEPGDPDALAAAATGLATDPTLRAAMGARGRSAYLERYTPSAGYESLIEIYRIAAERALRT